MRTYLRSGLIGLIFLISMACVSSTAQSSGYILYVQGGQSTIASGADGIYEITVQDIIPYCVIGDGDEFFLGKTMNLTMGNWSVDAALLMAGSETEIRSIAKISNLSIGEKADTITFQARSLEFYDRELLSHFSGRQDSLNSSTGQDIQHTALYLEMDKPVSVNNQGSTIQCCYEGPRGRCYMVC